MQWQRYEPTLAHTHTNTLIDKCMQSIVCHIKSWQINRHKDRNWDKHRQTGSPTGTQSYQRTLANALWLCNIIVVAIG